MTGYAITKRNHREIAEMYKSGLTYQQIADIYGVTKQYIGKIVKDLGLGRSDGGQSVSSSERKKRIKDQKERLAMARYGISHDEFMAMKTASKLNPIEAYEAQKVNASNRGVEFKFSFKDWWATWEESGKWHLRGRGYNNYCMARKNDEGPYEMGNVDIVTCRENIQEARALQAIRKLGVE